MPGNRNINSSPAHGRGRGAGHRGRGRGRGRGGNGRGSGTHIPSRLQNVQSGSATIGLDGIDFEGDLASFAAFASQYNAPARPKQYRARGNITIVPREELSHVTPVSGRKVSRGLGYSKTTPRQDASFKQWEATRPLLKPIQFVPAVDHKTLFQEVDEILLPPAIPERTFTEDPVPTARQVEQVFADNVNAPIAVQQHLQTKESHERMESDEISERSLIPQRSIKGPISADNQAVQGLTDGSEIPVVVPQPQVLSTEHTHEYSVPEASGAQVLSSSSDVTVLATLLATLVSTESLPIPLVSDESEPPMQFRKEAPVTTESNTHSDDDIVLYEMPEKSHMETDGPPSPDASVTALTTEFEAASFLLPPTRRIYHKKTPKKSRRLQYIQANRTPVKFGALGPMLEEQRLQDSLFKETDKYRQRRNGSDIDWGDDTPDDVADDDANDMLDPDVDQGAFNSFLEGMRTSQTLNAVTIGDLDDVRRLENEDNASTSESSDDSGSCSTDPIDEDLLKKVDGRISSASVSSSDESFGIKLKRIRAVASVKGDSNGNAEAEVEEMQSDDEILEHLQRLINKHKNGETLEQVSDSDSDDEDEYNHTIHSAFIPRGLEDQWRRDKAKKALLKRERQEARRKLLLTSGTRGKHGKRSKHDLLTAGLQDPTSALPGNDLDRHALENKIRDFVRDIGGKDSMVLPPMSKESRVIVHQLAEAFHLKSKSRGKGGTRFTTLFRTSRTGINIKDWKVERLVYGTTRKGPIKHREGDVVGKAAPKIGEGNLGYQMLQQMGWQDGELIGATGGLQNPLVAKIKNTKLGLGATH